MENTFVFHIRNIHVLTIEARNLGGEGINHSSQPPKINPIEFILTNDSNIVLELYANFGIKVSPFPQNSEDGA